MKKTNKNKSENRKALQKFLGICLVGFAIGTIMGFGTNYFNQSLTFVEIYQMLNNALAKVAPYVIWLSLIVLSGLAIKNYRQARDIFSKWDGEDDEYIGVADKKLSYAIMHSQINMIVAFFFMVIKVISNEKAIMRYKKYRTN